MMRLSIVLYNLPGVDKKGMRSVLHSISNELRDHINVYPCYTGFDDISSHDQSSNEQVQGA